MNKKGILVIGSVVRDIVILPNKKEKEFFGGTGGNIAYGLGILKLKPTLFSVVGKDFGLNYAMHLKNNNVNLKVFTDKKEKTAVFSIKKNINGSHIESWYPNVYSKIEEISLMSILKEKEFKKFQIVIFSPGTPKSTLLHMREFKTKNKEALLIFDPGQMINFYNKKQIENCIKLADIVILNEFEFKQIEKILERDILKLMQKKILIKTLGEKGSLIYKEGKKIKIFRVKSKKVISTVGAGDAYRAGMIFGLINNMSIEEACKLGANMASKNLAYYGCQEYKFSK